MPKYAELVKKLKDHKTDKETIKGAIEKLNQRIKPPKLDSNVKEYIDSKKHKLADHFNDKLQKADTKEKKKQVIAQTPIVFINTDEKTGSLLVGVDEGYMNYHAQKNCKKIDQKCSWNRH